MPNEGDSNASGADREWKPIPQRPVSATPPTPAQHEVPSDQKKSNKNENETAKELAREFRWVEFAQLAISGILAAVGIVALVIYHGQLEVMRGQLGEIIRQYPELQKSSQAARDSADSSQTTLNEATKNFIVDERAWVGVELKMDNFGPLAPSYFTYTFKFKNYGRSPALNIWTIDNAWAYGLKFPASPYYVKKMPTPFEVHSTSPLFPGEEHAMPGTSHISQPQIDEIGKGHLWWYSYGIITYDDIFGQHHTTHFCYRHGVNPPDNKPILCDTYNDAD